MDVEGHGKGGVVTEISTRRLLVLLASLVAIIPITWSFFTVYVYEYQRVVLFRLGKLHGRTKWVACFAMFPSSAASYQQSLIQGTRSRVLSPICGQIPDCEPPCHGFRVTGAEYGNEGDPPIYYSRSQFIDLAAGFSHDDNQWSRHVQGEGSCPCSTPPGKF